MNVIESAKLIRNQRRKLQMTQQELADAIGVTNKAVSKWENARCFPDITLFEKLAEVLQLPINAFLQIENEQVQERKETRWQCFTKQKFYLGRRENMLLLLLCFGAACLCSTICYSLEIFGAPDGRFTEILISFLAGNMIADIMLGGVVAGIIYAMHMQKKRHEDVLEMGSVNVMRLLLYSIILFLAILLLTFFRYQYVTSSLFAFVSIFYFTTLFYTVIMEYKVKSDA